MINVKIWTNTENGIDIVYLDFTEKEFNKIKKDSVIIKYDGSYVMKNGDVIEVINEQ